MHGYTGYHNDDNASAAACHTALAQHYCEQWLEFARYEFNMDALRPVYQERYCPDDDATNAWWAPRLSPIANIFEHACAR
jgi:hypothetical protein